MRRGERRPRLPPDSREARRRPCAMTPRDAPRQPPGARRRWAVSASGQWHRSSRYLKRSRFTCPERDGSAGAPLGRFQLPAQSDLSGKACLFLLLNGDQLDPTVLFNAVVDFAQSKSSGCSGSSNEIANGC